MNYINHFILLIITSLLVPNNTISQNIYTYVGNGTSGFSGDGANASQAKINNPYSVVFDASGNLYIADANNHRIRKVDQSGIITTIAGTGVAGFSGDGGPATSAKLNYPYGLAFDPNGNLLVADNFNHRIRKITPTGSITTIAGTGTSGYNGDGIVATSAQLNYPFSIATDTQGGIYISDQSNYRIRKITTNGTITTVAGTGVSGSTGNGGPATSAQITPYGICLDANGNLYIAEYGSNTVRKIDNAGTISKFAGSGTPGFSGDGGQAVSADMFTYMVGTDTGGNIYISDANTGRVRKVTNSGVISTLAGTGTPGYNNDGILASTAQLSGPAGICSDTNGNIYIADAGNNRVRIVCFANCLTSLKNQSLSLLDARIYPIPFNEKLFVEFYNIQGENVKIEIINMLGELVISTEANGQQTEINSSSLVAGVYYVRLTKAKAQKIIKVVK